MTVDAGADGPVKRSGRGTVQEHRRWPGGVTWRAHPDETMGRASHALATDAGVWVVEPVDADGLDDLLADLGDVAGVVVLASYHRRDAASVAARHGVAVSVPSSLGATARRLEREGATVERVDGALPGTAFELLALANDLVWSEAALWDGETLVAQEMLVTADHLTAPGEHLAVSPFRRLFPPRSALGGLAPERVLTGHGESVHDDTAAALADALDGARRRLPACLASDLPTMLRATWVALRD